MSARPSIEDQIRFYDDWNAAHRGERYEDIHSEIRTRADRVLEIVEAKRLPTREILEIGCGTGWFTEKLSRLGHVTAVDLSPQAIEIGKRRGTGADFIACNIFEHDFEDEQFDLVICVETLFYVEKPDVLVEKMASLCTEGGHLAVTTINKFAYERSEDVGPPEEGQIRNWLSRRETREIIERHFDIIAECTVEPRGELGILKLVNNSRLSRLFDRLLGPGEVKRIKETLGLGGGVIFVAAKRRSR